MPKRKPHSTDNGEEKYTLVKPRVEAEKMIKKQPIKIYNQYYLPYPIPHSNILIIKSI